MKAHVLMLPHLKKYALWREGLPPDGVLDLTTGSVFPLLLSSLLVGKARHDRRKMKLSSRYSAQLPFKINARRINSTRRYFLTNDNTRLFNRLVHAEMRQFLLQRSAANYQIGINEADTLRAFIDELDLHDDISYWALKKSLQRWRERHKTKKIPASGDQFVRASCAG